MKAGEPHAGEAVERVDRVARVSELHDRKVLARAGADGLDPIAAAAERLRGTREGSDPAGERAPFQAVTIKATVPLSPSGGGAGPEGRSRHTERYRRRRASRRS